MLTSIIFLIFIVLLLILFCFYSLITNFAKFETDVNNNLNSLTSNGDVIAFEPQADGLYATYKVGADTVVKKLGKPTVTLYTLNNSTSGWGNIDTFNLTSIPNYQDLVYGENCFICNIPAMSQYLGTAADKDKGFISKGSISNGILTFQHLWITYDELQSYVSCRQIVLAVLS